MDILRYRYHKHNNFQINLFSLKIYEQTNIALSHMTIYYNAKERQASELPGNPLGLVSPYIHYNHCSGRKQFWHVQSLETS